MALDLIVIRAALANTLRAGLGDDIAVREYPLPNPSLPSLQIRAGMPYVAYFETMGPDGRADVNFVLELLVAKGQADNGARAVDRYLSMGAGGIVPALLADRSLGGVVDDTHIQNALAPDVIDLGESTPAWQVLLPTLIIAKKEQN